MTMEYVFDTNSFVVIGHYFPQSFPSFWEAFDESMESGEIVSVREVYNELLNHARHQHLEDWVSNNKRVFRSPGADETACVAEIFQVPHFQALIARQNMLRGRPVADPFVIAAARARDGCVVTEERLKPDAAKIPNVCEHFDVAYVDLETFMNIQGWSF